MVICVLSKLNLYAVARRRYSHGVFILNSSWARCCIPAIGEFLENVTELNSTEENEAGLECNRNGTQMSSSVVTLLDVGIVQVRDIKSTNC